MNNVFFALVITYRLFLAYVGEAGISIYVRGQYSTCEMFYLLPISVKGWGRDTLAVNAQRYALDETFVPLPGW